MLHAQVLLLAEVFKFCDTPERLSFSAWRGGIPQASLLHPPTRPSSTEFRKPLG